jgi:hypothetical protein
MNMNKLKLLLLLAVFVPSAHAERPVAFGGDYSIGKDVNGNFDINRKWSRASKTSVVKGYTACKVAATGKGVLASANIAGAIHDWVAVYDSAVINNLAATSGAIDTNYLIYLGQVDTTFLTRFVEFGGGIGYGTGLVICSNTTTNLSTFQYFPLRQ